MREFKKKYNTEIANAAKKKREVANIIPRYSSRTGRPLLLGELDNMVQTYIIQLSNRGGVVNRAIANATAQALLTRYSYLIGEIDVSSSPWAQSLFRRMGFKKRRKTSSAVDIPGSAGKEIEYLFLHDIVDTVEKYKIPLSLMLNLDQIPLKYVPIGNETMALVVQKVLLLRVVLINDVSLEHLELRCRGDFCLRNLFTKRKLYKVFLGLNYLQGFTLVLMKSIFLIEWNQ